ncbi:MAG: glycerol acyltransferase [Bacteroidales bacterium]|nr:glycerol acyltransferase [Bacteroidales bacterium]MBK8880893.1 glycerol acyltransferase [Bacteroidales bacterium]
MTGENDIIDIEKVIRNSESKFVRSLPKFIIKLLKKLIYQDEMNETINRSRSKSGVPFINEVLDYWKIKIIVRGGENVPLSGRFVFAANHPVGGIDALTFLSTIYSFIPDVISPSNQLFNYIPNLHPVILGVNVFGCNTKETVEKFNLLFESDSQIMIFPAGIVSRRTKGIISDLPWQKTFITKSVQFKRDIIPVHISGKNSNLFYFVSNLRKFLRINMSLEIILLPREMMKQRNSTFTLTIGKPIPYSTLAEKFNNKDGAQKIKSIVYSLKG